MRALKIILAVVGALIAGRGSASAQTTCAQGMAAKLSVTPQRQHLRFTGTFVPPAGFDPLTQGLTITVAFEPDGDPANVFYTVTVPSGLFTQVPHAIRFQERNGAVGDLKFVRLSDVPGGNGMMQIRIARRGPAMTNTSRDGVVGVVLSSGSACVRSCVPCVGTTAHFTCQQTATAGVCS